MDTSIFQAEYNEEGKKMVIFENNANMIANRFKKNQEEIDKYSKEIFEQKNYQKDSDYQELFQTIFNILDIDHQIYQFYYINLILYRNLKYFFSIFYFIFFSFI